MGALFGLTLPESSEQSVYRSRDGNYRSISLEKLIGITDVYVVKHHDFVGVLFVRQRVICWFYVRGTLPDTWMFIAHYDPEIALKEDHVPIRKHETDTHKAWVTRFKLYGIPHENKKEA